MTESWERWEPVEGLAKNYYAEKVVEDYDGLSIILIDNDNNAHKILFQVEQAALAYRISYEGFRVKLFRELREKYGSEFHASWTFFKVNDSEYVKWIDQESDTIASHWSSTINPLQHICLMTMEAVIDVISYGEPKITFLSCI